MYYMYIMGKLCIFGQPKINFSFDEYELGIKEDMFKIFCLSVRLIYKF